MSVLGHVCATFAALRESCTSAGIAQKISHDLQKHGRPAKKTCESSYNVNQQQVRGPLGREPADAVSRSVDL